MPTSAIEHPTMTALTDRQFSSIRPAPDTFGPEPMLVESLEMRIAPAGLDGIDWQPVTFDTPILLTAGQGLATSATGGAYLLYVEAGSALIFTTDLNANGQFDANEITGIAAGNGLKLTSFVDINGDIVTNLQADGTLTDSDPSTAFNDGQVLLNNRIDSITLRTITADDTDNHLLRMAPSTYSIYGNIYAGGGLGTSANNGLVVDTSGWETLQTRFSGSTGQDWVSGELYPTIGYIMTGTAASGQAFSFQVTGNPEDVRGYLAEFSPAAGQAGGDIRGVRVGNDAVSMGFDPATGESLFVPVPYQIGGLMTGNGGTGARGGDIVDVSVFGDVSGFFAISGDGGSGSNGGRGGNITNFSDLGSYQTIMEIRTGNGGEGFNGKGGNGGNLSLGTFSTGGNISIILGDGGAGTQGGGNGAGLAKADFTPSSAGEVATTQEIVTTHRDAGDIGTQRQIDFNGDEIGDMIYASLDPNQLIVKLGLENAFGDYGISNFSTTFRLPAPLYSGDHSLPLAVGDFNGNGHLDIITASNVDFSRDSLYVYLWNPDLNDGLGGFDLPIRSPIPFWNLNGLGGISLLRSGGAITDIVVGDFNDDGVLDVGLVGQYFSGTGDTTKASSLVIMTGAGDGYFYADFAKDAKTAAIEAMPITNLYTGKTAHENVIIQATAFDEGDKSTEGIVVASPENNDKIRVFQTNATLGFPEGRMTLLDDIIGQFRERSWNEDDSKVEFAFPPSAQTPQDFAIADIDGNGVFDVILLSTDGNIIALKGDVDGTLAQIDDGKGMQIAGEFGVLGKPSTGVEAFFTKVVAGNFDGDDKTTNFSIYSISTSTKFPLAAYEFEISEFVQDYVGKIPDNAIEELRVETFSKPGKIDTDIVAFAPYQGKIDPTLNVGYAIGTPNSDSSSNATIQIKPGSDMFGTTFNLRTVNSVLFAGDGGDSLLGAGGNGGSLGSGKITLAESGKVDDMPRASITVLVPGGYGSGFTYVAGSGGNGFTSGGAGGGVSGLATRFTPGLLDSGFGLFAGDGGNSIQGKGGHGGDIGELSVRRLFFAQAGDGGFGQTGGNGGNIRGNGVADLYDHRAPSLQLVAGDAGNGVKAGGNGGGIFDFRSSYTAFIGGSGGFLDFTAGNGGDAVSGKGGNGGSINNSGPDTSFNFLVGDIILTAGDGGNGLQGGSGGAITKFINIPSDSTNVPLALSFIAGDGGAGVSGNGGRGGDISSANVTGTGLSQTGDLLFNRFIAGRGGDSLGATGGDGGRISNMEVSSTSSSLALAAGAGGEGLTKGGQGGSVQSSKGTAAGAQSKVLIVAGDGGSVFGFTATSISANPTPQQIMQAFGGVNSVGGNGGHIQNFTQPSGTTVAVDLIAGNGGSLLNYGTPGAQNPNVGRGGSITNVHLAGSAGAIAANIPILSYNTFGTPMSDFVEGFLSDFSGQTLTNANGNVGVVAGAAGRVKGDLPATNGLSGSVTNFTALNIMSMVAGSVDRISAIQTISNINLGPGGVFGAFKESIPPHPVNEGLYWSGPNGGGVQVSTANPGGSLIDGAILVKNNNSGIANARVFTT